MRFIEIDGKRYLWRELLKIRREQRKGHRNTQPALFELKTDIRPESQRRAEGRFREPSLFDPDN